MSPTIRWRSAPPVNGCRWCGVGEPVHGRRWAKSKGWHPFALPTDAQRLARWRARRAAGALHGNEGAGVLSVLSLERIG